MAIKQLKARILENKKLSQDFYKMRIKSLYLARNIKPGQFIEVRCSESLDPLLRRPFSVHRILKDSIEILYEVLGKGTKALSQRKSGELLDVIGPLGSRFTLNTKRYPLNAILTAGGIGIAPLVALAEESAKRGNKTYVIIGAKTRSRILCETEITPRGCDLMVSTEDGSKGYKGLATDVLKDLLSTLNSKPPTIIYACGPTAMLKTVAHIAKERKISCQVLLEEYMACGIGVCLGCPVKVKNGTSGYEYKMVCKDGPVFNAREVIW